MPSSLEYETIRSFIAMWSNDDQEVEALTRKVADHLGLKSLSVAQAVAAGA